MIGPFSFHLHLGSRKFFTMVHRIPRTNNFVRTEMLAPIAPVVILIIQLFIPSFKQSLKSFSLK